MCGTASDGAVVPSNTEPDLSHISQQEDTVPSSNVQMPEAVLYTSGTGDPVAEVLDSASHSLACGPAKVHVMKSRSDSLDVGGPSNSSCGSSVFSITPGSRSEENLGEVGGGGGGGGGTALVEDETVVERKNERRYRILLSHHFHSSRKPHFLRRCTISTDYIF